MKNNKLLHKIYNCFLKINRILFILIIIFIIAGIFLLKIPTLKTKKAEIKYITLKDTIIINDKKIIDYNTNYNLITNYNYSATIEYDENILMKIFKVSYNSDDLYKDYPYIKNLNINYQNDKWISFISDLPINSQEKYFIYYNLTLTNIFYRLLLYTSVFIFICLIYFIAKYLDSISEKCFIIFIIFISLIQLLFHFWIAFPGNFDLDTCDILHKGIIGKYHNWHPFFTQLLQYNLNKLFGYNIYYYLLLSLVFYYLGLSLIIIAIYKRFKNFKVILLFLISYIIGNIYIFNFNAIKDSIFTSSLWLSYSLIFFIILIKLNKKQSIFICGLSIMMLIFALLFRHNAIVTIYPIFILISFLILKNKKLDIKKYIIYFSSLMLIFAFLLISIVKITPIFFVSYDVNKGMPATQTLFLLQISACATFSNDPSLIKYDWYMDDKDFNDLKILYKNNPLNADIISAPWSNDRIFKAEKLNDVKEVWIKYIIKYPLDYMKYLFLSANAVLNSKIIMRDHYSDEIKMKGSFGGWGMHYQYLKKNADKYNLYENNNFDIQSKLYYFIRNNLIKLTPNIAFFISLILFILSAVSIIKFNNNNILIFTFSLSFSSIVTAIIVIMFNPIPLYRYIHVIFSITIISLISFTTFIYDIGAIRILKQIKYKFKKR